jgi:hypothetical protein
LPALKVSTPSARKKTAYIRSKGEFEMSHTVRFGEGEVEQRLAALEKYLTELQLHKDSRKGLDGARGEQGLPGRDSTAVGPQGVPGRDADITKVVEAALKRVKEEFDAEYAALAQVVRHELIKGGVLNDAGNAILIPGPAGPKGDSAVGLPGQDGVSVIGPRGRDAKITIGDVAAGEKASFSLRDENGVQFLDVVLPRGEKGDTGAAGRDGNDSVVPGPVGERGSEGERGIPGPGLSKDDIVKLVMDLKRRGSI